MTLEALLNFLLAEIIFQGVHLVHVRIEIVEDFLEFLENLLFLCLLFGYEHVEAAFLALTSSPTAKLYEL